MNTTRDLLVARLALERGWLTRAEIEECLHLQGQVERLGLPVSLAYVLEKKGRLTAEQAVELERDAEEEGRRGTQIGTILDEGRTAIAKGDGAPAAVAPAESPAAPAVSAAEAGPGKRTSGAHPRATPEVARSGGDPASPVRSALGAGDTERSPAPPPRVQAIGGYHIVRELGRGAMGIVYEAMQENPRRPVALKVVSGDALGPKAMARFRREAEAVGRLTHPNIVRIYEAGEENGIPFLAMERIEGRSLEHTLLDGRMPWDQATRVFEQAADAIHYAHQEGIIHRDLKPANLMLAADGRVIITDFGLARDLGVATMTASGAIMGTPMYMPPEQAEGKVDELDRRTDVYALAATLYEVLTGRPLFAGDSVATILNKVIVEEPRNLRSWVPEIPRELEWVVLKALRKEPERRYQTAAEFREDLRRLRDGFPVLARPSSILHRTVRTVRRNRVAATTMAAAVALLVGGGLTWWWQAGIDRLRGESLRGADAQVRSGNLEEGLRLLDTLIAGDPDFGEAHLRRGQVLARLGRHGESRESLRRAVARDRRSAEAWTELGIAERLAGRPADSREAFERALSIQGSYALARVERAEARALAGDHRGAGEDFAVVADSPAPDALRARAECGLAALALASGKREEAENRYEEAHGIMPDSPVPYEGLGECRLSASDFEGADGHYEQAIKLNPLEVRLPLRRAWAALRLGEPDRVLAHLEAAERLSPGHPQAAWLRAVAGPAEGSRAQLDEVLKAEPGHLPARRWRARLRMDAGDREGAREDVEALAGGPGADGLRARLRHCAGEPAAALEILLSTPGVGMASRANGAGVESGTGHGDTIRAGMLLLLAQLRAEAGELASSHQALADASRAAAGPADEGEELAFLLLQDARRRWEDGNHATEPREVARSRRELRRAFALAERSARLLPELADAHLVIGHSLLQLGRWRDSLAALDRALAIQPAFAAARAWRAILHCVLPDFISYSSAREDLEIALALEPEDPRWRLFRARLRVDRREVVEARGDLDRLLAANPDHAAARHLSAELDHGGRTRTMQQALHEWRRRPGDRGESRFFEVAAAAAEERNDFDHAVALYQEALRLDPTNAYALLDLGRVFENAGDRINGLYYQFRASELHPDLALRMYFRVMPQLRRLLGRGFVDPAQAAAMFGDVPDEPLRDVMSGFFLLVGGRGPDAVRFFDRALKADPESMIAHCFKGAALALSGKVEEGRAWVDKAAQLRPGAALPIYFRACVEAAAGDQARALDLLGRCLALGMEGSQETVRDEPFFKELRTTDEFKKLLAR